MFGHPSDLPLKRDATGRFLPWVIAVMVYLAALALAGAMVLESTITTWSAGLTGTMTVQIPVVDGDKAATRARVDTAVRLLEATPGIARVRVLDRRQIAALLEPWLGPDVAEADLPLPRLIDVTLTAGTEEDSGVDVAALGLRLTALVPDAVVDDHRKWLVELVRLARSVELLSAIIVLLIVAAAVATVVFAARAGLAVHHTAIEVMHLVGARDSFIARQFQRQALQLGLLGGMLGMAAAVGSMLLIGRAAARVAAIDALDVALAPEQWAVLATLPFAAAFLAMITARITVLRTLARMP